MSIYDYSACIKLTFDRPIIEDPEVITGTEETKENVADDMISVKSTYSGSYPKKNAIDGLTTTKYCSGNNSENYYQVDFIYPRNLYKIRFHQTSGDWNFTAFTLQGSNDGISFSDVTTGTTDASTGWHEYQFTPAIYRYWRLKFTQPASYYIVLNEIEYYSTRTKYKTDGWEVTALEPQMVPLGPSVEKVYKIRKITKSEDGFSVFIWLDLPGRIKYPLGDITVRFTGTLIGPGGANVEPFVTTFSPTLPTKIFNPSGVESLKATAAATVTAFDVTYRYAQQGAENLKATAESTITVTKVGSLPI